MKDFIKKMLSSSNETSSKRFNGTIGFMIVQILIIVAVLIDVILNVIIGSKDLSTISVELIKSDLIVSATLLGASAVEKIWNKS